MKQRIEASSQPEWTDVLIIGAGFGGMRMLHECRELGLESIILEAATDLGGTWYWNRYPGARTDTESWAYCFYFSEKLNAQYSFKERYATWDSSLDYLNYAADALDMRRHMRFQRRVTTARYIASENVWEAKTDTGETYRCRYLVAASGVLSAAYKPPFKDVESFKGEVYMTAMWPKEPVDFAGKRVAVIGTGASGVQVIPIIAHEAAQVTVFQRTPNYVLPARNAPITDAQQRAIRRDFHPMVTQCQKQVFAFPMTDSKIALKDVSSEEQQRVLEWGWEIGGFQFAFETFNDILLDRESNAIVAEFVRKKIRAIVKDPKTAELLSPDYALFAKRPPLGHFYFETFNRPNVSLVDVSDDPIEAMTPTGLKTRHNEYGNFDAVVYATGFDGGTGALVKIDVRGTDGQSIAEIWRKSLQTQFGICMNGFPNFFMISGPQAPFANTPMIVDRAVTWIGDCIRHLQASGNTVVETRAETCAQWTQFVQTTLDMTVLADGAGVNSWFLGKNIPGKLTAPLFFFGGANNYFIELKKESDGGFKGMQFGRANFDAAAA
jgi:cation diffusion facilitator CzcD-associated flavoprotein CzcO